MPVDDGVERTVLCAGPYALERWRIGIVAAPGARVRHRAGPRQCGAARHRGHPGGRERLARAESLLLPAGLGRLRIEGPADVLLGHLPDLDLDVRTPLLAAGHGPAAIAALGEGLTPEGPSKPTRPASGV
ncbi:hypothetical protein N8I84_03715 [Streptomyces cynarae]|uniref:Uncharacterized protein n=1 Tax=Streptomyces cynarae TaxID=2981134 RepID=A0ABY6DUA0_9ACTN|nr:hypothetical protein [Streptomyces cynarae]UXY17939.1 hypothetical protein N8I84_03715 [Streptomyces cynarae]